MRFPFRSSLYLTIAARLACAARLRFAPLRMRPTFDVSILLLINYLFLSAAFRCLLEEKLLFRSIFLYFICAILRPAVFLSAAAKFLLSCRPSLSRRILFSFLDLTIAEIHASPFPTIE